MKNLNDDQLAYWNRYLNSLPAGERPVNPFVTASFAGTREMTDELLQLYLIGKKSAGSSIVEDFVTAGDPLPKVGNYWIFLNSQEIPSCSLEYWRKVHSELYTPYLKSWGVQKLEDATVITEFFKIVFK